MLKIGPFHYQNSLGWSNKELRLAFSVVLV